MSMPDRDRFWVGFSMVRGIGPTRIRALLDFFGDIETAWLAPRGRLRQAGLGEKLSAAVVQMRGQTNLDRLMRDYAARGIRVLTWENPAYPRRLLEIDQPPPVLYVRGELVEQDLWSVAVVGTRRVTGYGRQVTAELAAFLARNGVTVVSGLARGVDTVAHQAALQAGGRSIAVLGCGVDQTYPPENAHLAEQMAAGAGALVSDYPVGTPPEGLNFPPRNRIISGLALAVVVVEAGEKSGALITADFALEQGREIFAVPGQITAPQSAGTNRLISNGAHPYLEPVNVLDILDWVRVVQYPQEQRAGPQTGLEADLFERLGAEPLHIDELRSQTGLPVEVISATLTLLELKGLVKQVGSMRYSAVRL